MCDAFVVDPADICSGLSTVLECDDGLPHSASRESPHKSEDGFRLSTVRETLHEMHDLDDGFSLSTTKASLSCDKAFELSTIENPSVDLSQLSLTDAELLRCLPATVADAYARRLCGIEQSRRDAEDFASELEERRPRGVSRLHVAIAVLVLLAASLGGFAFSKSRIWGDFLAGNAVSGVAALGACTERFEQAEARSLSFEARIHRDALGYQEMLGATESWTTGTLDQGGFWTSPHKPGLAFCINSTHAAYREMAAELAGALEWRHMNQVAMLEELWAARSRHLLSPQVQ